MPHIQAQSTVAGLVRELPARSRVFESLGIDYCCGGKKTLEEVCAAKALDVTQLIAQLESAQPGAGDAPLEAAANLSLTQLIEDIIQTHHEYLRQELPRLAALLRRVDQVHGDRNPNLAPMLETFLQFAMELSQHMMKEEQILFPAITALESGTRLGPACFGTIAHPIRQMEAEHDDAGNALETLSALSNQYTPPDWACNTYRAVLDGLAQLEKDMHIHVYKENNILFPKAIQLESGAANSPVLR